MTKHSHVSMICCKTSLRLAGCFREVAALHSDHLRQVSLYSLRKLGHTYVCEVHLLSCLQEEDYDSFEECSDDEGGRSSASDVSTGETSYMRVRAVFSYCRSMTVPCFNSATHHYTS